MPKHKKWSRSEIKTIEKILSKGIPTDEAVDMIPNRTKKAILVKMRQVKGNNEWSGHEIASIIDFIRVKTTYTKLKELLMKKHTEPQIRSMIEKQKSIYNIIPHDKYTSIPPIRNLQMIAAPPSKRHLFL